MDLQQAKERLDALELKNFAYNFAMSTIMTDTETVAPKESHEPRGIAMGILSGEQFQLQTSDETLEVVNTLFDNKDSLDEEYARRAEILKEDLDKIKKIPMEEYTAYTELMNASSYTWVKAKNNNDFASFAPFIEKIIETQKRFNALTDPDKDPYDVQLDAHEEGTDRTYYDAFFNELKETLVPLIAKIRQCEQPDNRWLKQTYPLSVQRDLSDFVMDAFYLDKNHCSIGETEHPFTGGTSSRDVRITTHYYEKDPVASLYSVIHEGGHANYELHVNPAFDTNCLGGGASMAMHESQSRFWENYVGRSRAFVEWFFPYFQHFFPDQTKGHTAEEFYRCVNMAMPSLVRTEADELTYSMHVLIRYELEKQLFNGSLKVKDLPEAWNAAYQEYLGVQVPNDSVGVLQDVHWSQGMFGYFPTYSLGTAYSAQILETLKKELPFDELVAKNELKTILQWLSDRIYRFGRLHKPGTFVPDITGAPFTAKYYTDYLTKKFSELYHLS